MNYCSLVGCLCAAKKAHKTNHQKKMKRDQGYGFLVIILLVQQCLVVICTYVNRFMTIKPK